MNDPQSPPREPLQPAHFEPLDIPSALQKLRFVSRVLDNFAQAPVSDRADANQFVKELIEVVWKSGHREQPAIEAVRLANQAKDWAHRASKTFYEHISRGYLEAMNSAIDSLAALSVNRQQPAVVAVKLAEEAKRLHYQAIQDRINGFESMTKKSASRLLEECIDSLAALAAPIAPAAESEQSVTAGWISASERLPEEREKAYQIVSIAKKHYPPDCNYPGQGVKEINQDWVIRRWPENFTFWMNLPVTPGEAS